MKPTVIGINIPDVAYTFLHLQELVFKKMFLARQNFVLLPDTLNIAR
jgi:hypothetical protein